MGLFALKTNIPPKSWHNNPYKDILKGWAENVIYLAGNFLYAELQAA
jgi:hypothetical protein